jgi:glycosyltransferase involved in cell wall biosynthesis/2-polyprenyl-3-methyl-5-hydroxy-6-metoxy-1,4-benzoquinol methylase
MLNACTIIACNYLPYARVLADSFLAHHREGRFTVLLVDDEQRAFTPSDDRVSWLRLEDIGLDRVEIRRLAGIYDVTELSTAVKPQLLRHLLEAGADSVIYLDPDISIYDSLQPVADLAAAHGIVLTPHTMRPFPKDERQIDGFFVLAAGVYNLGFIAVGKSAGPFLDWWWATTRREALIDVARMMFTDQRWVDFVPSFFEHYILKDPGYNVAYWNLHGREVFSDGDHYLVNGAPLRFFHFSGFDARKPWLLSKHQGERPRVLLSERPALAQLCRDYLERLIAAGINVEPKQPYGWNVLPNGIAMTTRMRRLYWNAVVCAEQGRCDEPSGPFDEANPAAFIEWLNTPAEGGPRRVSRFLYSLYQDRVDLHVHFPDIFGVDAERFNDWIWADGVRQEKIPAELLPARTVVMKTDEARTPTTLQEGLNIAGYFRAELGIGEAARQLMNAVETAGIPFATTTYGATLSRQDHPFAARETGISYDVNVLCVNADSTPRFARDVGPGFFAGRHTAGYWFWEVEQFPTIMWPAFDVVDEVWTATDFIADAIRGANGKPVFTVPLPVQVPKYSQAITRARLGLPDRFTFLFAFDFLSVIERKNPQGVIEAFKRAFKPEEGPVLVIKSINGEMRLAELEWLRALVGNRLDIWIVDSYYSDEEKSALAGACDCYVSLHRSEGLGLTMAEAMALGKPVIATGYSGNTHFMTPENSFLVDYVKVPVPKGCGPYPTTASWADPDLDQAASYMRLVFEAREEAGQRARRGQQDILERHNREISARAVAARLAAIRAQRRSRIVGLPGASETATTGAAIGAPAPVGVEQLAAILAPLAETSTLRLSADGRSFKGLRLATQRAFFRVLRPLWFQQHQFHAQLVAALRLTAASLRTERNARETVDRRVRELTRKLMATRGETQRLARALAGQGVTGAFEQAPAGETTTAIRELQRSSQEFQTNAAHHLEALNETAKATQEFQANAANHLQALTGAAQEAHAGLTTLSNRLFAVPYMADPDRFMETDQQGRTRLGYRVAAASAGANGEKGSHGFYLGFEDVFRGPEALIRERQRAYLPLLQSRAQVVDLGCGRGEMLDLLREAGVPARGVDTDADMVRYCREKGHAVEQLDILEFMREQAPQSLPAIFSAQVIEHLRFADLKELLELCRSRLQPGGVLIAETVNPHALEAFKTFYTDLTHERPIFPEVALSLVRLAHFEEAYVMFPRGSGELDRDRQSQGEYAVVATATT